MPAPLACALALYGVMLVLPLSDLILSCLVCFCRVVSLKQPPWQAAAAGVEKQQADAFSSAVRGGAFNVSVRELLSYYVHLVRLCSALQAVSGWAQLMIQSWAALLLTAFSSAVCMDSHCPRALACHPPGANCCNPETTASEATHSGSGHGSHALCLSAGHALSIARTLVSCDSYPFALSICPSGHAHTGIVAMHCWNSS